MDYEKLAGSGGGNSSAAYPVAVQGLPPPESGEARQAWLLRLAEIRKTASRSQGAANE